MRRWLHSQLLPAAFARPPSTTTPTAETAICLVPWGQASFLGAWRSLSTASARTYEGGPQGEQEVEGRQTGHGPSSVAPPRIKSAGSLAQIIQRFSHFLRPTPPVRFIQGMPPPTALSWMRRRGPEVPHTLLHRLFRQKEIRLVKGGKVTRVSAYRQLSNGDLLLFPNWVISQPPPQGGRPRETAAQQPGAVHAVGEGASGPATSRVSSHAAAGPGPRSSSGESPSGSNLARSMHGADGVPSPPPAKATPARWSEALVDQQLDEDPEADEWGHRSWRASRQEDEPATSAKPPSAAQVLTPERVRRWVLGVHPGLLFINKPAGVRVHGRSADDGDDRPWRDRAAGRRLGASNVGPLTLDGVMQRALKFGEADEPRLVHRLDQQASGVMVVARNADAATWLSAAFQGKASRSGKSEDGEGEDGKEGGHGVVKGRRRTGAGREPAPPLSSRAGAAPAPELSVRRTYWAFLAGDLQPRQSGTIKYPIVVDGVSRACLTTYRVKATGCGVTWVELTPETGRRHQLRIHCARKLGAPIIGDGRYGYRGLPPRLTLRERLPPEWWALLGERPTAPPAASGVSGSDQVLPAPILLHARELVVRRPGKAPLVAVAPMPRYMRELIAAAGWPQPATG